MDSNNYLLYNKLLLELIGNFLSWAYTKKGAVLYDKTAPSKSILKKSVT